jgi:hypothetical protein
MLARVPASSKGMRGIVTRPGAGPSVARQHQDPDGDLDWAQKHLEESVAGGSGCKEPAEPQDRGGGSHHIAIRNATSFSQNAQCQHPTTSSAIQAESAPNKATSGRGIWTSLESSTTPHIG